MTQQTANELEHRRDELVRSLPALSQQRDATYRLNSDAVALDRAGVKHRSPEEMVRLKGDQTAADSAIRGVQQELRRLDAEIESAPGGGLGARVGRAFRRGRADR